MEFLETIKDIPVEKLVYIDESGMNEHVCKKTGYAKKGEKIYGKVSGKRISTESFVAAKIGRKIVAPGCYNGICDSVLFNTWLEGSLIPTLRPGQIVIMDNAAFHKTKRTKELIEKAGCRLLFLPPYSPQLNPIEKFWAHFKNKVRIILENHENLRDAIMMTFCSAYQFN